MYHTHYDYDIFFSIHLITLFAGFCLISGTSAVCRCDDWWRGAACNEYYCPKNCNGHGRCTGPGDCDCDVDWYHEACDCQPIYLNPYGCA